MDDDLAADMKRCLTKKTTPGLVLSTPLGEAALPVAAMHHPGLDLESPRALRERLHMETEDSPLARRGPNKSVAFAKDNWGKALFGA